MKLHISEGTKIMARGVIGVGLPLLALPENWWIPALLAIAAGILLGLVLQSRKSAVQGLFVTEEHGAPADQPAWRPKAALATAFLVGLLLGIVGTEVLHTHPAHAQGPARTAIYAPLLLL